MDTLQKPDETFNNSIMENSQQEMLARNLAEDDVSVKSRTQKIA